MDLRVQLVLALLRRDRRRRSPKAPTAVQERMIAHDMDVPVARTHVELAKRTGDMGPAERAEDAAPGRWIRARCRRGEGRGHLQPVGAGRKVADAPLDC